MTENWLKHKDTALSHVTKQIQWVGKTQGFVQSHQDTVFVS
jgi:hypothetical protein